MLEPCSDREKKDQKLTAQIKQFWLESGGLSGYRNLHEDLIEARIPSGRDTVLRLMRTAGISAQRGYKRPKGYYGGKPQTVTSNLLERQFEVEKPNERRVSDITCIHTHEGFLFQAVVMDLYARNITGWSLGARITDDLVFDALTMVDFRRRPPETLKLHSDQGSQDSSHRCKKLLKTLKITPSVSRRGNAGRITCAYSSIFIHSHRDIRYSNNAADQGLAQLGSEHWAMKRRATCRLPWF